MRPWTPPPANDEIFIADIAPGQLDAPCRYRSGGDIVFSIDIDRFIGNPSQLLGATDPVFVGQDAYLRMPIWDVQYNTYLTEVTGHNPGSAKDVDRAPERNEVYFNNHLVPAQYLSGEAEMWVMNKFRIPLAWVNFPSVPGQVAANEIRIVIDTWNDADIWCTSIDWASLEIKVARPVVFVHGIFSNGATWNGPWTTNLSGAGLAHDNSLNLGNLEGISRNAGLIRSKVTALKAQWNVDKVNIVAHSKGGLDAREFVETGNDVEQLIQIGTPNRGSPLADLAQISVLGLTGPFGSFVVNGLAGPGGLQLMQPYMAIYNQTHGHNAKVRYTSLGGVYDPNFHRGDGLKHRQVASIAKLIGPGDLVVPLSSVHGLPYASHDRLDTVEPDRTSWHTNLTTSAPAYTRLRDEVAAFDKNDIGDDTVIVAHTASRFGVLGSGASALDTMTVDPGGSAFFTVMYPAGRIELELRSPSGVVYLPSTVEDSLAVNWNDQEIVGGRMGEMAFDNAEAGAWQVTTRVIDVGPGPVLPFAVTCWLPDSPLDFSADVVEEFVRLNLPFSLEVRIANPAGAVSGAVVRATVMRPDAVKEEIVLHDDGLHGDGAAADGFYAAQYANTAVAGWYRVVLTGETAGGSAFSREAIDIVSVSAGNSRFGAGYHESALDDNGNDFFDRLDLGFDVDITLAGNYRWSGTLRDQRGHEQPLTNEAALAAGAQILHLEFDGRLIFNRGTDGPYELVDLWLAESDSTGLRVVDHRSAAYSTQAWFFGQFEHGSIVTGPPVSTGVDDNGDGLFDHLAVEVPAQFRHGGVYEWNARLEDRLGTGVGFASGRGKFVAGSGTLDLVFDGRPIHRNGVDGPFVLADLLVYSDSQSSFGAAAGETDAYLAAGFAGNGTQAVSDNIVKSLLYSVRSYPNPFNPLTKIEFSLPVAGAVSLRVFDVTGRMVRILATDAHLAAGVHAVPWNGTDQSGQRVASGVYFFRFTADRYEQTGRIVLLK